MMRIIKGRGMKDCLEHRELQLQIDSLKRDVAELKCGEHEWVKYDDPFWFMVQAVRCKHCGKEDQMLFEKWDAYQIKEAKKLIKDLGGEVK